MENNLINKDFWDDRWKNQQTGWDIGYASPAIIDYMRGEENKNIKILIPGCGNAYEAKALIDLGFTNITLIDISPTLVETVQRKYKGIKQIHVKCEDFFELNEKYDLVIEQTFFCALDPILRREYVTKMTDVLTDSGKIIGLMFDVQFEKPGPPYGGSSAEYRKLFSDYFTISKMELSDHSIAPRKGTELFVELIKK